jgi:tRNA 2-thiouridine synthesizing protein B
MLHIVNKSPYERNSLDAALRSVTEGSALLLIEDAVYAATQGNAAAAKIQSAAAAGIKVFALKPDLETRGVADRVMDGVSLVDYGGFVDLVAEQPNCQSWL